MTERDSQIQAGDDPKNEPIEKLSDDARRELLRKLTRFGAYTAPALLGMYSTKASAALSTSF